MALLSPTRFLVLLLAAGAHLPGAEPSVIDEYRIKAAFLYNFAKFVEWPAGAFKDSTDPIAICVLGNPFGGRLEETVNGKQIDDRRLIVREIGNVTEAAGCHILFVASDKKRVADLLDRVKANPILTVGEAPNFAASGGVVDFKLEHDRVRLEINPGAAGRAHLRVSSKLLSLAAIVKEDKK